MRGCCLSLESFVSRIGWTTWPSAEPSWIPKKIFFQEFYLFVFTVEVGLIFFFVKNWEDFQASHKISVLFYWIVEKDSPELWGFGSCWNPFTVGDIEVSLSCRCASGLGHCPQRSQRSRKGEAGALGFGEDPAWRGPRWRWCCMRPPIRPLSCCAFRFLIPAFRWAVPHHPHIFQMRTWWRQASCAHSSAS